MKRILIASVMLLAGATLFASPCLTTKTSLPAPAGLVAEAGAESVDASWTAVPGATKYAVEVVGHYDDCGMTHLFTFTILAPETSISIPLEELQACADYLCIITLDPEGVDVRVKALNPPRGKEKETQCNPFSDAAGVDFCGDGVDGNCDGEVDEGCVCDTRAQCAPGCFSYDTAEGRSTCAELGLCDEMTRCGISDECGPGEACIIDTCCNDTLPPSGYCAPVCNVEG